LAAILFRDSGLALKALKLDCFGTIIGIVERARKTVITNIQGYSIHDGPGIRTVVFFKGCPLRCRWCANPETMRAEVEIGFLARLCTGCGHCFPACPAGAIRTGGNVARVDRGKCTACGACVEACRYGALVAYGEEMTSEEVFGKVRRDKMFYDTSGGGVTVSGGEPLLHPGFVRDLFERCKAAGIATCVETCGNVPREAIEEVAGLADQFYFDLKVMDADAHERHTGCPNERILANARYLAENGVDLLFRQPLIPGVNDGAGNIEKTAGFMKSLGAGGMRIQLLPYHRMGQSKYAALDRAYPTESVAVMAKDAVETVREAYIAQGVECTISR
jgi:pyruvate formate lyase activating enzyme